jgi:hypothetical protein
LIDDLRHGRPVKMQPAPIFQTHLPEAQRMAAAARLPQMYPVGPGEWLRVDGCYSAQLAEKARLIAAHRDLVLRVLPRAEGACAELLDMVLGELDQRPDYACAGDRVTRPDGVVVIIDRDDPLRTLSQLVQEDFCLHLRQGDEHVLMGALLCFPMAWTLAEKIGRPLSRIHAPVAVYDADIAARVQRMFDMVRADRPLWRANAHGWDSSDLFRPCPEAAPRPQMHGPAPFTRSERQTIRRLPVSDAVVFSIHTTLVCNPG